MAKLPLAYLRVIRASSMHQTIVEGFHSMVEIVCIQVTVEELSYEMMLKRSDTIFREVHPCSDVHGFGTPTHNFFQNIRHDARVQSMHSHVTRFRVGVLAFVYAWSSFSSHIDIAKALLEFVQSTTQRMLKVIRSGGEHAQRVNCGMRSRYARFDRSIPCWTHTIGIDADVHRFRRTHLGIAHRTIHAGTIPIVQTFHLTAAIFDPACIRHGWSQVRLGPSHHVLQGREIRSIFPGGTGAPVSRTVRHRSASLRRRIGFSKACSGPYGRIGRWRRRLRSLPWITCAPQQSWCATFPSCVPIRPFRSKATGRAQRSSSRRYVQARRRKWSWKWTRGCRKMADDARTCRRSCSEPSTMRRSCSGRSSGSSGACTKPSDVQANCCGK